LGSDVPRNTKKASERIFYRKVENWDIWKLDWLWTAPGLVFCVLAFFPLALIYQILSLT
jgi:hypothetical protein